MRTYQIPCSVTEAQKQVTVGSQSDPFYGHDGNTWASILGNSALYISRSDLSPTSPNPSLYITTAFTTTLLVDVLLNSTEYSLKRLYTEPVVQAAGFYQVSQVTYFFIDVLNTARTQGYVGVNPTSCCYAKTGIVQPTLSCSSLLEPAGMVLASNESTRFTTFTPITLSGTSGYCSFRLDTQSTIEYPEFDIPYTTPAVIVAPPSPGICNSPFYLVGEEPWQICQSPCTIDQTYNATNEGCDPVDCVTKYLGGRNWYSTETGTCKSYSGPTTPTGSPSSSPSATPISIPSPPGTPVNNPSFPIDENGNYTIECGEHGEFDAVKFTCECDLGWATDNNQPIYSFKFCNMEAISAPDERLVMPVKPYALGSNPMAVVLGLVITFVVLLIAGIILFKCYKSKSNKNEEDDSNTGPADHEDDHGMEFERDPSTN